MVDQQWYSKSGLRSSKLISGVGYLETPCEGVCLYNAYAWASALLNLGGCRAC